jgi:hypothetical protein
MESSRFFFIPTMSKYVNIYNDIKIRSDFENDILIVSSMYSRIKMTAYVFDLRLDSIYPVIYFKRKRYVNKLYLYGVESKSRSIKNGLKIEYFVLGTHVQIASYENKLELK